MPVVWMRPTGMDAGVPKRGVCVGDLTNDATGGVAGNISAVKLCASPGYHRERSWRAIRRKW